MIRLAVMVSGGGTNLQAVIDAIEQGTVKNAEIAVVISNKKDAYALQRAEGHGIKSCCIAPKDYETRDAFGHALIDVLEHEKIDLVVLAGYLVILPEIIIKRYKNKMINIHPSLIPSFCGAGYYGLKVHEAALARGVKVTGATVHFVDEGTDTGPIIIQKAVEVRQDDTPLSLQRRVMEEAEWKILPQAIDWIAGGEVSVVDGRVIKRQA